MYIYICVCVCVFMPSMFHIYVYIATLRVRFIVFMTQISSISERPIFKPQCERSQLGVKELPKDAEEYFMRRKTSFFIFVIIKNS